MHTLIGPVLLLIVGILLVFVAYMRAARTVANVVDASPSSALEVDFDRDFERVKSAITTGIRQQPLFMLVSVVGWLMVVVSVVWGIWAMASKSAEVGSVGCGSPGQCAVLYSSLPV